MSQQSSKSGIGQDLYTYTCAFRLLSPSLLVAGRFDLSRHAVLAYPCRTKFFPSTNPSKEREQGHGPWSPSFAVDGHGSRSGIHVLIQAPKDKVKMIKGRGGITSQHKRSRVLRSHGRYDTGSFQKKPRLLESRCGIQLILNMYIAKNTHFRQVHPLQSRCKL